jgi:hypothetical protein
MRLSGWIGHEELTPLDPAVRSDAGAYDRARARLTLERSHLEAQRIGAALPRAMANRAPDAGCARRRRASASFPVLYPRTSKWKQT